MGKTRLDAMALAGFKPDPGNGKRLDHRTDIAARVRELAMLGAEAAGVHIGRTLEEVARCAYSNMRDLFDLNEAGDPVFRDITKLPIEVAAAIREVKLDKEGRIVGVKLHDKASALNMLISYLTGVPAIPPDRPEHPESNPQTHDAADDWNDLVAGRGPGVH